MHKIFTPLRINRMVLPNRFVRSATMDNMGKDGIVTDAQVSLYRELGKGEIGLVISHGIFPAKNGHVAEGQLGAHIDEMIPSLKKLADAIHDHDGRIAGQILHGGCRVRKELFGFQPVGPSALIDPETGHEVRELEGEEINELIESFVQASRRLIEAGFDAVQLHGAHGWLPSAFLSPVMNRRCDEWGGSLENRLRFVKLICEGIRKIAGPDYPLLIKLGLRDYHPEGKPLPEGIETARMLESIGVDSIEVSEGIEKERGHHIRKDAVKPYYLEDCLAARKSLSLPLILVGGMRDLRDMKKVIDDGIADAVSMCRPFINNPYLVKEFHEGITEGSECNSCNECTGLMRTGNLRCVLSG